MRKKVYVSGALTNVRNLQALKEFYEAIADLTAQLGLEPYVPHKNTGPKERPDVQSAEVATINTREVRQSDLIIAYTGEPSLGTGMELGIAQERNIPVIILHEQGAVVSRMPRGHLTAIEHIEFEDFDDALDQLRAALHRHRLTSASAQ